MLLLIDKPKGMTSHDVVDFVRNRYGPSSSRETRLRRAKVGHAGTLDPNATGLLIVGVGRESTKKLGEIAKGTKKTYIADIFLGESRTTDDIEGEVVGKSDVKPSLAEVEKVLKNFLGKSLQSPPAYSALKIKGKKAYELARAGREVKLEKREIKVYKAKIISYKFPILKVSFEVSSGTYIRALARDIGKSLGTLAYLKDLRRTKIGKFDVKDALALDEIGL